MAYVVNNYGQSTIWNLSADDYPIGSLPLVVATSTLFRVEIADGDGAHVWEGKGSFSYPNGSTSFSFLRGTMSENKFYTNGLLEQMESSSSGIDVVKYSDYNYLVNTILAGDDEFYGSLDPSQVDHDGVRGGAGNDKFFGGGDPSGQNENGDFFIGESGLDTSIYRGSHSQYLVTKTKVYDELLDDGVTQVDGFTVQDTVQNRDGKDNLVTVERLKFSDLYVALDLTPEGHAGQAMEFIGAVAPSLLDDASVRGTIISLFDQGQTMESLSQLALDLNLLPTTSNADLANAVYHNVLGGIAALEMTNALVGYIESHSQANFLATVAGMNLNVDLVGLQQMGVEYLI